MAIKKPLCLYGGMPKELQDGDTIYGASGGASIPAGTVIRSGPTAPAGFYRCNGALLDKAEEADLYAAIGDSQAYLSYQYNNGQPWVQQYYSNDVPWVSAPQWSTLVNAAPVGQTGLAVIAVTKNFVYLIGGRDANYTATYSNVVSYAEIYEDGTIGPWMFHSNLPATLHSGNAVIIKNYIYILGAKTNNTVSTLIYRATIYEDGTISAFTANGNLNSARYSGKAVVVKNRVHIIGCPDNSTTISAPINSDGSLGTWVNGPALNAGLKDGIVIVTSDRVYYYGGSTYNAAYYAIINSDGTLGSWTTTTYVLPTNNLSSCIVTNNYVYMIRTNAAGATYMAPINSDGTIPGPVAVATSQPFPVTIGTSGGIQLFITSSKIYGIGYYNTSSPTIHDMYVADFSGGSDNYIPDTYTAPDLANGFFIPDTRAEDSHYPNDSLVHYIKY